VHYNRAVSKAILALIVASFAASGGCEKKKSTGDTGAINALDHATVDHGPVDETPLSGIDVSKLGDKQKAFYKLIGSLSSPCGKGESLRKSYTSDTSCKRAPFAVRYVAALLADEGSETDVRQEYEKKYTAEVKPVKLDISKSPHFGAEDAPIKLVEFFDYQCPHCQAFKPMLEQVVADEHGKVAEYFKMFPLPKHVDSKNASQAALAAGQMGKFKEMHDLLFAKSPAHTKDDVVGYAKQLGLDQAQFEVRYAAAAAAVDHDIAEGEAAGVDSTPTLFFNDRKYEGPMHPKYIEMWIEEELAVNR